MARRWATTGLMGRCWLRHLLRYCPRSDQAVPDGAELEGDEDDRFLGESWDSAFAGDSFLKRRQKMVTVTTN
jgi:hypothetical protein